MLNTSLFCVSFWKSLHLLFLNTFIQVFLLICLICYSKKGGLHMISIMLSANVLPNVQIRQVMNLSEPNSKS